MHVIDLILYIAAFIVFVLAALRTPARFELIALGLALWVMVPLLDTVHTLGG